MSPSRFRYALIAVAMLATAAADPQAGWQLDTIPWEAQGADGTRYALLEGRRDQAGKPFTYAFAIPAGTWDAPHRHSTTARVFVASGALRLGYGTDPDRRTATTYPAGSIVIVPGGAVHFDGADVDTVIMGVATGRWSTRYSNPDAPASAGTPVR